MIVGGTMAAMATLDLEPINAFFHYAFYLAATVLLRVIIGLPPLGGSAAPPSSGAAGTVLVAHFERATIDEREITSRQDGARHTTEEQSAARA